MKKAIYTLLILILLVSSVVAQKKTEIQLANEYYGQGEYEKAIKLYEGLSKNYENVPLIHNNYFFLLNQLDQYKDAENYIRRLIKKFPDNIYYHLDLGLIYYNQGDQLKTEKYFSVLIDEIKFNSFYVRIASDYFINKQLNEYTIKLLKEARKALENPYVYALELANIYRITGEKELMVEEYFNFITQNPANISYVTNNFQVLLSQPEDLDNLQSLLYDKIQRDPDNEIYAELLIWVNLQKKEFYAAFIQARALDKRLKSEGSRCIDIGLIALDNNDYQSAIKIFSYVAQTYPNTYNALFAKMNLIQANEKKVRNTYPINQEAIRQLINDYNNFVSENGIQLNTISIYRNKAKLHALYLDEKDSAVILLNKIITAPSADPNLKAQAKLDLADIYILLEQPWESALLYAQVEKSNKEEPLGYEAKLKNAKLSYYKGDFQLAQAHLDILKEATTRKIANDAMALSLLIKNNTVFDTTQLAMRRYAAIELLLFQHKTQEALAEIEKMKVNYLGHSLTDELLWLSANEHKKLGHFEKAIADLQQIVDQYSDDIWADDAYFTIGELYEIQLKNTEKAMEIYRDFLGKYPGSVYVAEARKRFRHLRGDIVQ